MISELPIPLEVAIAVGTLLACLVLGVIVYFASVIIFVIVAKREEARRQKTERAGSVTPLSEDGRRGRK